MVHVSELHLAATDHGEAAVLIVVVLQAAIVNHSREVGMLVLVRTEVVAVGISHYGQSCNRTEVKD